MSWRRHSRFLPAVGWAVMIFYVSSQSVLPQPIHFPGVDKVEHAVVFGVLALLLLFGASWPTGWSAHRWILAGAAYGVLDELHQRFVPGRMASIADVVADFVGCYAAYGAVVLLRKVYRDRNLRRA